MLDDAVVVAVLMAGTHMLWEGLAGFVPQRTQPGTQPLS